MITTYFTQNPGADRFELFHPDHPFLQTAGMDDEKPKPLSSLLAAIPSGTNAVHFHHAQEEDFGIGFAAAARLLTTLAPFMTAGGAGLSPSINGAPPWYALLVGETLFQTLCLNTFVLPHELGEGKPAWRNDEPPASKRATNAGLLDGMTWRPRRIQLIRSEPGKCALTGHEEAMLIRTMYFAPGASVDFFWQDPNVAYRVTKKGMLPLRPQEDHELWRDTGPLLLLQQQMSYPTSRNEQYERPQVVTQLVSLQENGFFEDAQATLFIYGMRTDMKMKIFEWQRERLPVPEGIARPGLNWGVAQQAIELAESVAFLLKRAIKVAYPRQGGGNENAFDTRITHAARQYWQALRDAYNDLLAALSTLPADDQFQPKLDEALSRWQHAIEQQSRARLDEALYDLDTNAATMKRVVDARQYFSRATWALFNPEAAAAQRKKKQNREEVKK